MEIEMAQFVQFAQESFRPERSAGTDFCVQLEIEGDKSEIWAAVIRDQTFRITQGEILNWNARVQASRADLFKLLRGELNPAVAFFTGRVKISGDQGGLLKMISLFDFDKEKRDQLFSKYR